MKNSLNDWKGSKQCTMWRTSTTHQTVLAQQQLCSRVTLWNLKVRHQWRKRNKSWIKMHLEDSIKSSKKKKYLTSSSHSTVPVTVFLHRRRARWWLTASTTTWPNDLRFLTEWCNWFREMKSEVYVFAMTSEWAFERRSFDYWDSGKFLGGKG